LRFAYLVRYVSHTTDAASGKVLEIHCTYDPESKGGSAPDGRKVKGTIHWVSAEKGAQVTVRLYDRLFKVEDPEADKEVDFLHQMNPHSKVVIDKAIAEPSLLQLLPADRVQFERLGYFYADHVESQPGQPVFNRTVTLKDSWEVQR